VPNSYGRLTIHAGDLFWETMSVQECKVILSRLHGRRALLFGNHDEVIAGKGYKQ
jgi:calcineurin-like phosphoesterase family protein